MKNKFLIVIKNIEELLSNLDTRIKMLSDGICDIWADKQKYA